MTHAEVIKGQYMVSPGGEAMKERLRRSWADPDWEAQENLEDMSPMDLFMAWLEYEGIIGYTDTIIERLRESGFVVEAVEDEPDRPEYWHTEGKPADGERVLCVTQTKKGDTNIVIGYWMADPGRWVCGMNSNVIKWAYLPEV